LGLIFFRWRPTRNFCWINLSSMTKVNLTLQKTFQNGSSIKRGALRNGSAEPTPLERREGSLNPRPPLGLRRLCPKVVILGTVGPSPQLWKASSGLYWRRFLRPNTHSSAFFKLYKITDLCTTLILKIYIILHIFVAFSIFFRKFA
jgi:hypothetical protein